MKKFFLASALTMALPMAAMAQSMDDSSQLSKQDKMFIKKAAEAGLAEVADGQLAKQQGDGDVKKVADRMIKDHSKANEQLADLSAQLGDPAPTMTDSKHQDMHDQLAQLSGSHFDDQYLQEQETGHEKTISLFQKEIADGSNPQLKQFASDTLPTLQMHLQMIQKAEDKKGDANG